MFTSKISKSFEQRCIKNNKLHAKKFSNCNKIHIKQDYNKHVVKRISDYLDVTSLQMYDNGEYYYLKELPVIENEIVALTFAADRREKKNFLMAKDIVCSHNFISLKYSTKLRIIEYMFNDAYIDYFDEALLNKILAIPAINIKFYINLCIENDAPKCFNLILNRFGEDFDDIVKYFIFCCSGNTSLYFNPRDKNRITFINKTENRNLIQRISEYCDN
jgi:hypothetical protein